MPTMGSGRLTIFQSCALDDKELNPAAFRVLAALGTYSNPEGWCSVTDASLALRLGVSDESLDYMLKAIRALGYIEIHPQEQTDGGSTVHAIRLILDYVLSPERLRQSTERRRPVLPQYRKIPISAAVRNAVFERDGRQCKYCGTRESLTIDHIIPESQGGPSDSDNLQVLCWPCNKGKGVKR